MRDEAVGPITLKFTWAAIDRLVSQWGEDEYEKRLQRAVSVPMVDDLAFLIEVAGGPDAESTLADSPPLSVMIALVSDAWQRAWLGSEEPKPGKEGAERNGPLARLMAGLMRGFAQGKDGTISGG